MSVNWETHKISPSISFTLAFHILPAASENTRRDKLNVCVEVESKSRLSIEVARHTSFSIAFLRRSDRHLLGHAISMSCSIGLESHEKSRIQTCSDANEDHQTLGYLGDDLVVNCNEFCSSLSIWSHRTKNVIFHQRQMQMLRVGWLLAFSKNWTIDSEITFASDWANNVFDSISFSGRLIVS